MIYRKLKDNNTYTYSDGRLIICSEDDVTYLCFRDSVNPLYYPISQLINHYFHTVE